MAQPRTIALDAMGGDFGPGVIIPGAAISLVRHPSLSFIFTGSFKLAGSIALTEMFTKMFLYYVHERIWSAIPWSQRGQPAKRSDAS